MCMIDQCDEFPSVYSSKKRRAKMTHTCDECRREIAVGETYERFDGKTDADWWSCKTCAHCIAARGWLTEVCGGFVFHGVRQDLEDHWEEDPLYHSLTFGRVIVGIKNHWQRKGEMLPIPSFDGYAWPH